MKNLQKNIDRLMLKNDIKKYSDLLRRIGMELKEKDSYKFVEKQKGNFSKMLSGDRPLAYDFIAPLEKILGATFAELTSDNQFEITNEYKPYLKGIRYYAYLDDPKLYKELEKEIDVNGRYIIENYDEYSQTFVDYLIKYKSINGFRFLIKTFGLTYHPWGMFKFTKKGPMENFFTTNIVGLGVALVNLDIPELFHEVFNPFDNVKEFQYIAIDNLYKKEEFLEAILHRDHILKSLFEVKDLEIKDVNPGLVYKDKGKHYGKFINPVLNIILDYALKNVSMYKKQLKEIINYGISHNKEIINQVKDNYSIDKGGFIKRYMEFAICGCALISNYKSVGDSEIDPLISKLNKGVKYEIKTNNWNEGFRSV